MANKMVVPQPNGLKVTKVGDNIQFTAKVTTGTIMMVDYKATHIKFHIQERFGDTWSNYGEFALGMSGYRKIKDEHFSNGKGPGLATITYELPVSKFIDGYYYRVRAYAYDWDSKTQGEFSSWSSAYQYLAPSSEEKTEPAPEPDKTTETGAAAGSTVTTSSEEVSYFEADWSNEKEFDFATDAPPAVPQTPKVTMNSTYQLKAELSNIEDTNASHINFEIVKDNKTIITPKNGVNVAVTTSYVILYYSVEAGSIYKVRCRSYNSKSKKYSDWTQYSDNIGTVPSRPDGVNTCKATSETSVYLEWDAVPTATSYDIEYTTETKYFDGSDKTTTVSNIEFTHYELTGLESGQQYFFRVRASNENGSSDWCEDLRSVIIGKDPAAPTTWSSTTTLSTGEPLTLYWVHNSEDGSSQTYAELELTVNGSTNTLEIQNSTDEDEKDKTSFYVIDTSKYVEGTKIQWRVRTAGITNVLGDWSIERTVDIYAPPVLTLVVTNSAEETFDVLNSFPFRVLGMAGPSTQKPIGYHLTITALNAYEAIDNTGNRKWVASGDQIYSKHFDIDTDLSVYISAKDVDLENNVIYKITCVVSMNSGLTATAETPFAVQWEDEIYEPNIEIGFNLSNFSTTLRPYCQDELGSLIEDITLSVYRREYDGRFTEIASNLANTNGTYIMDPHPALDYARYRIVAVNDLTGAVSYYDAPGFKIGAHAIIIQWDEEWSSFNHVNGDPPVEPVWSGSMVALPYNIDVSESNAPDVSLVEYVGRSHPVSYYGTQLGTTTSWNTVIPKTDKETLYALRRLSNWMGNVYVREPSGIGYWANIKVSLSQKNRDLTIPVTLNVTRVEGGI